MKLKDKLGYLPLVIVDSGYSQQIYGSDGLALPIVKDDNYIKRRKFNNDIMNKFIEKAKNLNFIVLDVSPEEYDMSLEIRINRANVNYTTYLNKYDDISGDRVSVYIALQYDPKACNWDDTDNSLKILYLNNDTESRNLANLINNQFDNISGGIKASNNYVLKHLNMQGILIDASFMDLKEQVDWMQDEDFIDDMADKILLGCLQYFGIKNIEDVIPDSNLSVDKRIKKLQEKVDKLDMRITLFEEKITDFDKFI
ncbi:N-acetylmuramoyl-L-alanine amidase [Vallitalea maricola]|uniref:Uncharacterized protein n=1 Tax=Vallitalea maricola TaxID=3074433 RepID=A0ACB5UIM1_9FIRM|nr:hypothetical protein AN2V17_16870 [Vallitalea sp. AN17-2]